STALDAAGGSSRTAAPSVDVPCGRRVVDTALLRAGDARRAALASAHAAVPNTVVPRADRFIWVFFVAASDCRDVERARCLGGRDPRVAIGTELASSPIDVRSG